MKGLDVAGLITLLAGNMLLPDCAGETAIPSSQPDATKTGTVVYVDINNTKGPPGTANPGRQLSKACSRALMPPLQREAAPSPMSSR